jgi:hypothetical protein
MFHPSLTSTPGQEDAEQMKTKQNSSPLLERRMVKL